MVIIVIVTTIITAINITIKIIVIVNLICIIICITLTFSKVFIVNHFGLHAIVLTTKSRFNGKTAYCILSRLGKDNSLGKACISTIVYDITRKKGNVEIFHCMYIGTAVDLRYGTEYNNYGSCMWTCIRTFNHVCAFCYFMGGGGHV